ncbi:hypothetical protein BHE97_11735 [Aeromicrobium sp. PE09-221]|nr:hypothetical protein BHE97_11735 [Aeromicrobium sp. PE09-221]
MQRRSSEEWLATIGEGVREHRLLQRVTQAELADSANVSVNALQNLEHGRGAALITLIKVIRALDLEDWLDGLSLPDAGFNPLDAIDRGNRKRRRAR